jgi:hypothetical protein
MARNGRVSMETELRESGDMRALFTMLGPEDETASRLAAWAWSAVAGDLVAAVPPARTWTAALASGRRT